MKIFTLIIFGFWSSLVLASQGIVHGQMYEQGSKKAVKLYEYLNNFDDKKIEVNITDLEGKPVVKETAVLDGSKLIKYEIDQKQVNAKGTIEVKDGRVYFTKEVDGKVKTDDEKLGDTLVVTANFTRFIKDHWKELLNKDDVDLRFGVWDRMETVGFGLSNQGTETIDGVKCVKIKMKASSFIIAAIVKPLYMYFTEDGEHLVKLDGRVAPKKKVEGQWKDLDAEVYYQSTASAAVAPEGHEDKK